MGIKVAKANIFFFILNFDEFIKFIMVHLIY